MEALDGLAALRSERPLGERSLRARFTWLDVQVRRRGADQLRDALALLATTLQAAGGRKSAWQAALRGVDAAWEDFRDTAELEPRVRLVLGPEERDEDALAVLRVVLGLAGSGEFDRRVPRTPLCLAVRTPMDAGRRGAAYAAAYLHGLVALAEDTLLRSRWDLRVLDLDLEHVELDRTSLPLLELVCRSIPTVSTLALRVPDAWRAPSIADMVRLLDACGTVQDLRLLFTSNAHSEVLLAAIPRLENVSRVELVRCERRRSREHVLVRQEVDLTPLLQPAASTSRALPTLRLSDWNLNPVLVSFWFGSPLSQTRLTRIASLDLDLDATNVLSLLAVLGFIGPSMRALTLRSKWVAASQSPEPLPLAPILEDCPELELLEIHGFRTDSLVTVANAYAHGLTRVPSLAFINCQFDDQLRPGLLTLVGVLANRHSRAAQFLRELRVDPVPELGDEEIDAVARMVLANRRLELLLIENHGAIPALWSRVQTRHLQSPTALYAFLSVATGRNRLPMLARDCVALIFAYVGRVARTKLRQRC